VEVGVSEWPTIRRRKYELIRRVVDVAGQLLGEPLCDEAGNPDRALGVGLRLAEVEAYAAGDVERAGRAKSAARKLVVSMGASIDAALIADGLATEVPASVKAKPPIRTRQRRTTPAARRRPRRLTRREEAR
jgi:hypothetical protein